MKDLLIQFLRKLNRFSDKEVNELSGLLVIEPVKKDTLLVREGQICQYCYFVLKGCLRQYVLIDGVEKTTSFYTEEQAINFFTSTISQTPATSYLCSLEDSILLIGNPQTDPVIYKKYPKLEALMKEMVAADFGKTQDYFSQFIISSPEERYLTIVKERPELIQRVPLRQLAGYLGMTPESLSRIRKRISKNHPAK